MKVYKVMKYSAGAVIGVEDGVERISKKLVYYSDGSKQPVSNNDRAIIFDQAEAMDFALKYNQYRKEALEADLERNAYFLANLQSQK